MQLSLWQLNQNVNNCGVAHKPNLDLSGLDVRQQKTLRKLLQHTADYDWIGKWKQSQNKPVLRLSV